jgi:hypothetical protein
MIMMTATTGDDEMTEVTDLLRGKGEPRASSKDKG